MNNKLNRTQTKSIQIKQTTDFINQSHQEEIICFNKILKIWLCLLIIFCGLNISNVNAQNGQQPARVTGEGSENVSLYSGRLNFNLPLISAGGRGSNSTGLNLHIKEKPWNIIEGQRGYDFNGNLTSLRYKAQSNSEINPVNTSEYEPMTIAVKGRNSISTYLGTGGIVTVLEISTNDGNKIILRDNLYDGQIRDVTGGQLQCGLQFNWQTWSMSPPAAICSRGKNFHSADGSAMTFVSDEDIYDAVYYDLIYGGVLPEGGYGNATGFLYTADGTKYRFLAGIVIWSEDKNGNQTTFSYQSPAFANGILDCTNFTTTNIITGITTPIINQGGGVNLVGGCKLLKITDSIGREVNITYGTVVQDSYYDTISYKGFEGGDRQIKIYYGRMGNSLAPGENLNTPDNLFPIPDIYPNIPNAYSYSTSQKTASIDPKASSKQKKNDKTPREKSLDEIDKYNKKNDVEKELKYQENLLKAQRKFASIPNVPKDVEDKLILSLMSKKKGKTKLDNNSNPNIAQLRSYCDPEIDPECGGGGDPDPTPDPNPTPTPFPTATPTPPPSPIGDLFNPMVAQKVVLPDGQEYQFKYNRYGELGRVIVPTGGYTDYEYGALPNPREPSGIGTFRTEPNGLVWGSVPWQSYESPAMIYRRVAQKKIYDFQGNLQARTEFGDVGYLNPVVVKTFEPNGTAIQMSKHHYFQQGLESVFTATGTYGHWKTNKEFKTEVFDPNNPTNPLRITETQWEQRVPITWGNTPNYWLASPEPENDPRVTEVKTTLENGQVSAKTFSYDQFNNLTDTNEYDFGAGAPGAFLRRSHTDYVTDPNYTAHTSAHLRRLPVQAWVSSDMAGANKVSLTQNEYDNYISDATHAPLLNRSGVIGHNSTNYGVGNPWRGNVTKSTSFANAANQSDPISAFSQYDILGNPVKIIDAKGNASNISYADNFGSPNAEARTNSAPAQLNGGQTFAFATSAINAAGWTTYAQFDYFTGVGVDAEDTLGVVSSSFYNDLLDRPTQTIAANNTNQRRQTTIVYDTANRRVLTTSDIFNFGDNLSKGEGFYDGLGRTREVRKYEENGGYVATLSEYDALSRVKRATNPFRPNEPQLWTTTNFDALGRGVSVTTPDGATATTSYSGLTVTATDPAGKQRRSVSNGLGQLMRVDEPDEAGNLGSISSPIQPTSYNYDTLGNLVKVTQGVQNRFFKYDSLGRMIRVSQPEQNPNPSLALADAVTGNSQWTAGSTYDANGNAISTSDAKGVVITNTYDILNRPLTRTYSDATPAVTNAYDNPNIPYSRGKLTSTSNVISATQVTAFDNLGRPISSQQITNDGQTPNGQVYNFGYAYNLAGALIEETYPSGRKVKNTFEADGDLAMVQTQKVGSGWENRADSFSYNSAGAAVSLRLGNNRWESTQFNARLQPVQLALGSGQNATDLLKLNYDYGNTDNNGNVKTQTTTAPGINPLVQNYDYDSLNRLKIAEERNNGNLTWKQTFQYDRYGNRKFDVANTTVPNSANPNITNPNIDLNSNRFTAGQGYVYDLAGNVVQDAQGRQFIFNGDNKQVEVRNSQNQIIGQYFYDSSGARVKKITNTETTLFVYSGGKLIAEYSPQNIVKEYVYAGSRMLSTEETATSITSYLTADTLGSPRIITDQNGNVQSRRDFMPFGEDLNNLGGRSQTTGYQTDNTRQKFTGYEKDDETGLDFAEARYYNNLQGRFTAVDPLLASGQSTNPQTFNRYAYVANNPIILTDPTGMILGGGENELNFIDISGLVGIQVGSWASLTPKQQQLFDSTNRSEPIEVAPTIVNADGSITGGQVTFAPKIQSSLLWNISAGMANSSLMPSEGSAFLNQSQLTTFIGVTSMWTATGVIDKIASISEIRGDVKDDAFRLRGYFKAGGGEFIRDNWVKSFGKKKDGGKYTESYREQDPDFAPNGQFTMTKDLRGFDSDVDYHPANAANVLLHNTHENSDIRQNNIAGFLIKRDHMHLQNHIKRYGNIPITMLK